MPYLNEDDLVALHKQIDDAQEKLTEVTEDLDTTTEAFNKHKESSDKNKKTTSILNIILGIIAGIALALAFYFYNSESTTALDLDEIKQIEANRILDSISNAQPEILVSNNTTNKSVEETTASIKNNLQGQKVYSVQIGAFTKNRYTLLSETIAGTSSENNLFKYSIGLFQTLREAQDFRRELVQIGFDDAFVASYIDGVRQEIEQPN